LGRRTRSLRIFDLHFIFRLGRRRVQGSGARGARLRGLGERGHTSGVRKQEAGVGEAGDSDWLSVMGDQEEVGAEPKMSHFLNPEP
jgi:hypothetical protein